MNQFFLVLRVIVANWKKAKGQLFFTILGIAIASTLWSSIDIVNNQTIKAQKRSIDLLKTAFKPIIIDRKLPHVSQNDYVQLRLDGWLVNPVIREPLENTNIIIVGIDLFCAFTVWLFTMSMLDQRVEAIAIPNMVKKSCPFAFFQFATITFSTRKNWFISLIFFLI